MVKLPTWRHWPLHIRYLEQSSFDYFHPSLSVGGPPLPSHLSVTAGRLEELDWFRCSTPTRRRDLIAAGELIPDTLGEEPQGLRVPRFKSRRGALLGKNQEITEEETIEHKTELDEFDEEEEEEEDDVEVDELDEDEEEHDMVDDDEFCFSQSTPASAAAVAAAASHPRAAAAATRPIAYGDDDDDGDADRPSAWSRLSDCGFHYDESSHSFILLSDDDSDAMNGVLEGGAEEEEEIDMTNMHGSEGQINSVDAATRVSSSASAAASSSPSLPARPSSCAFCRSAPPLTSTPQATQFGLNNLMTVCPSCRTIGHLLCWQAAMQRVQVTHTGSGSPSLPPPPLIPAPAPCPFCATSIAWCHLVDGCHRFHAPINQPRARVGMVSSTSSDRSISQYLLDAAKKTILIVKERATHAKAKLAVDKAEKASHTSKSSKHVPPDPTEVEVALPLSQFPSSPIPSKPKKRRRDPEHHRSRSLTPTIATIGLGDDANSFPLASEAPFSTRLVGVRPVDLTVHVRPNRVDVATRAEKPTRAISVPQRNTTNVYDPQPLRSATASTNHTSIRQRSNLAQRDDDLDTPVAAGRSPSSSDLHPIDLTQQSGASNPIDGDVDATAAPQAAHTHIACLPAHDGTADRAADRMVDDDRHGIEAHIRIATNQHVHTTCAPSTSRHAPPNTNTNPNPDSIPIQANAIERLKNKYGEQIIISL